MNNGLKKAILPLTIATATSFQALAVPAYRGLIPYPTADGDTINVYLRGDEHSHYYMSEDGYMLIPGGEDNNMRYAIVSGNELRPSSILATNPNKRSAEEKALLKSLKKEQALAIFERQATKAKTTRKRVAPEYERATFPSKGSTRSIVILVEFSDKGFSMENPKDIFDKMLNKEGFSQHSATGSALDYFKASSNGLFTPEFDVYGPVKLTKSYSYYGKGNNDDYAQNMIVEACEALDDTVDFTIYDTDNDGKIDNVYVFYAGYGEADGGGTNTVWPHSWDVYSGAGIERYLDGKLLDHYATSNELKAHTKELAGIGTFCHEFSHVLGLPDLYATSYNNSFTPGAYSILDYGSYSNDSHTPPSFTGYERYCLDWVKPIELFEPDVVTLGSIEDEGGYDNVYIIKTDNENEYYILENRQQKGWDTYIPGHGMLVWHIDYDSNAWGYNTCNNVESHQRIDIEEADNIMSEATRSGDTYPGASGITSFTDQTTPSMVTWTGQQLDAPITEITETDGKISFKFRGGVKSLNYMQVNALEATELSPTSFTANWEMIPLANDYLISLFEENISDPKTEKADFATGSTPSGWTTSGSRNITDDETFAVELPSRKLFLTNSSITTKTYDNDINALSFWYRASEDNANNALTIKGVVNGITVTLSKIQPLTTAVGGEYITINDIPEGCKKLSISYTQGSGYVAIDDIIVTYGIVASMTPVEGMTDIPTGNVSSYQFKNLKPATKYGYSVTGIDTQTNPTVSSITSRMIIATTTEDSGVENVTVNGNAVEIARYTIDGRLISKPQRGVNIISYSDGSTRKVIVK